MSPKLNRHHPSQERDPRDAAERWLDFGRWLAGERTADEPAAADFSRPVPSFAGIAERHFRDLVPYAEHGNSLELRRAMHRRFIQALHLAFGPETLNDLAVHQPLHVFRLIEHLRAERVDAGAERARGDRNAFPHPRSSAPSLAAAATILSAMPLRSASV